MIQRGQEIDCKHFQDYNSGIRGAEYHSSQEAGIIRKGKKSLLRVTMNKQMVTNIT